MACIFIFHLDRAYTILSDLGVHVPGFIERDVRSKLVIHDTDTSDVAGAIDKTLILTRKRRIYQCSSGVDHTSGNKPSNNRKIPWQNVNCTFWMKLTTTHTKEKKEFNATRMYSL
jgi:hypothetical protein